MPIKIKRVGHLVLKVKDLDRSRKFFTEVLGFPQVGENDRRLLTGRFPLGLLKWPSERFT